MKTPWISPGNTMQRPRRTLTFHHLAYSTILFTLLLSRVHSQESAQKKIAPTVDEVLKHIGQGNKETNLGTNRNLIIVMGLTGTGKSTLISFLTGDNSKLIAKLHRKSSVGYIIDDGNNKIGNEDHISKTLYPDLSVDGETNETLVDCPGFMDTRPYAIEIATAYFTKKVLEFAENVKIIFTIGQNDMTIKGNFVRFLKSATELIPNVSKLQDGIGLVVTKVKTEERSDDVEIREIIKYLVEVKKQITHIRGPEDIKRRKRDLIDAFLDTKNGNKIALFKKPMSEGPLSDNTIIQENKITLRDVIFKNIKYASTRDVYFNYTLTADTVRFIQNKINPELLTFGESESKFISYELVTIVQTQGAKFTNIFQMHNYISRLNEKFENYKDLHWDENSMVTFQTVLDMFSKLLQQNKMKFSYGTDIRKLVDMHNFFKKFTDDVESPIKRWVTPFIDFMEYLSLVKNWYEMITNIGITIKKQEIQKTKNIVLGQTLLDYNMGNKLQNVDKHFLKIIDSQLINKDLQRKVMADTYHREKRGISTDKFILRDIRFILNVVARKAECKNGTLYLQSNFVSVESDVKWAENNVCENVSIIQSVNIIAFEKLFIDADLNYNEKEVHVSIIAPTWEVIGTRKINLYGVDGKEHSEILRQSAVSHGEDGIVGNPGKPGGSFFGVGYKFINNCNLTVSLMGGRGGRGQNGGIGRNGKMGLFPEFRNKFTINELAAFITEKEYNLFVTDADLDNSLVYTGLYYVSGNPYMRIINSISGTNGWDGGNGGSGGIGATNGHCLIVNLGEETLNINVIQTEGSEGNSGKGGLGGKAGTGKASIIVNCNLDGRDLENSIIGRQFSCLITENRTGETLLPGKKGMKGVGMQGLKQPRLPRKQDISQILYNYRVDHVKESCIDNDKCMFFYDSLLLNKELMSNVKLTSIVKEIDDIDFIAEDCDLGILIQHFKGIESLLDKYLKESDSEKYGPITHFMKEAMYLIRERVEYSEVKTIRLDLKAHVEYSNQHLEKVLNSQGTNLLLTLKEWTSVSIEPTINDIWRIISSFHDTNIMLFTDFLKVICKKSINDVGIPSTKLIEESHFNKTKVIDTTIKNQFKNKAVFEIIHKCGEFVQFLGNLFCILSKGYSKEAELSEEIFEDTFTCQTTTVQNLISKAESLLQSFIADAQPTTDYKNSTLEIFYAYIETFLKCHNSQSQDDLEALGGYEYAEVDIPYISIYSSTEDSSNKLPRNLNKIYECLLKKNQNDQQVTNALKFVNFLLNSTEDEINIAGDLITQFDNINITIPIIEAANEMYPYYKTSMKLVADVKQYFYPFMHNFISIIKKNLEAISNKNFAFDQNTRDILIENLDQFLNVINKNIKKMEPDCIFLSTLSKFEEFHTLIKTFLIKFESLSNSQNLYSVQFGVPSKNKIYSKETEMMAGVIQRNEILKIFKSIITQYIMASFPLAHIYLDAVKSKFKYEKGVEPSSLHSTTQKIIQQFQTAIYGSIPSITSKRQKTLKHAMFTSSKLRSAPFFIWNSKSYKFDIDNFLSGKEIILYADITQTLKNLIQFETINLRISLGIKHSEDVSPEMLQNALLDFDVELTHMGNSKYKCDTKYYIVRGESVTFRYSLAQGADREPLRSNEEYKRMLLKEIKLSPYAMWRMRLIYVSLGDDGFSVLDKFKGQVDLELEGGAFYSEPNSKICYSKLNEFYEEYDPLEYI